MLLVDNLLFDLQVACQNGDVGENHFPAVCLAGSVHSESAPLVTVFQAETAILNVCLTAQQ